MKKIILMFVCIGFALTSKAQSNVNEVALIQSAYGMEKKQLIVDHMKITDAESAKFWTVYDKYEIARKELGKKRIDIILEYAKNYSTLTDAKATELMNASLANHSAFTKLQQSTFKEMSKALTPVRAAQWIQVEVYLETVIRMKIADEIPLIESLDTKN